MIPQSVPLNETDTRGADALLAALTPSRLYAMPVKGQTVTLGGTGSLTGQMELWKSQAGTLALNAPANFTGQTVISEGTLEVNTDLSSSPVSLRARGTLSGSGKVGALSFEDALNHEGCRLQPKGTLTVTRPLTIERKVYLELDSPDDLLEVQGDLHLTATLFVNITGSFVTGESARYHLIHYTGEYAGEGSVTMVGLAGLSYDVVVEDGYVDLIVNEQRQPAEGVTWSGVESALWDYQADNWTLEGAPTGFVAGDGVVFNNEAQRTAVTLSDLMPTASVSVRGSKSFTLGGEGGISGSSSLTMDGTGTWNVGYLGTDATYAGSFSSTATLCKYGEGSLTLTGSGAGALRIYGGSVLANNASAPVTTATTTVHSGGTLSGIGQVGAVTVNAGGTLSAGSGATVGALRLTGRTTVASGAVLAVRCRKMSATATPSCDHWEQDAAVSLTNPLIRITKTSRGDLAAGDELQLFTGSGTVTVSGTPTIEVTGSTDVFTWDTSRLASEGVIVLTDRTTGVGNLKAREEEALPDGKFLEDGRIVIRKDGKRYTVGGNRK